MEVRAGLSPRVLLSAIDTIYASSFIDLADKYVAAIPDWKAHHRAELAGDAEPLCILIAGERFRVIGGDRSFPIWLQHTRGILKLRATTGRSTRPTVYIEMSAEALHGADGPRGELWFWERVIMPELLGLDPLESMTTLRISRIDVHADVAGIDFDASDLDNFVSRADDDDTKRHKRKVTGFMFGKRGGTTVARIYNKLWDIECKPAGSYLLDHYGDLGLRDGESVWRIEFEFHIRALHERGIVTAFDAIEQADGLFRYGVQDWLWLSVPDTATRRSRRDVDPRWKLLQDAAMGTGAEASKRITKQRNAAPQELALTQSVGGCATSYGGLIDAPDFDTAWRRLGIRVRTDALTRGIDLDTRVREKAGDYSAAATTTADAPLLYPELADLDGPARALRLYQVPAMRFDVDPEQVRANIAARRQPATEPPPEWLPF